jgi:hypothetical protein
MSYPTILLEEMNWSEMYDDESSVATTLELENEDWEIVAEKKPVVKVAQMRAPRWCRDGNACKWIDCGFRHQTCQHGKRCRYSKIDPNHNKSPEDGGCPYDHRQAHQLMSCQPVTLKSESEMWDHFGPLGLEAHSSTCLSIEDMDRAARKMLFDSLEMAFAAGILCELDIIQGGKTVWYQFEDVDEDIAWPMYDQEENDAAAKSLIYWEEQVAYRQHIRDERIVEHVDEMEAELNAQLKAHDDWIAQGFAARRSRVLPREESEHDD